MRTAMILGAVLCAASVASAVDKGKAVYVGGTLTTIKEKTEAPINLKDQEKLVFTVNKANVLEIPWAGVEEVEYGQKVGRRIKTAILLSPIALFSKSRHHFVTISWKDAAAAEQAVVFEFDKDDIRANLAILRARSGKDITFQDDEARKQMGGAARQAPPSPAPTTAAAAATAPTPASPSAEQIPAPAPSPSPSVNPR